MSKKVITVIGATGAQGNGLVHAILNDKSGEFTARAVTRDTNSQKAKDLANLGAEVINADVDDIKSLQRAFEGAYGAYCVTFYWAHFSPEKEYAEAAAMAQAAGDQKVQHVIWSTLEDTRQWVPLSDNRMPTLMERYKVPHFDAKGEANKLFTGANLPVTLLLTSFYWDNFIHFGMGPKKQPDGSYGIAFPMDDKKLAAIAAEDIGKCAFGIFKQGSKYIRQTVGISGEQLTGQQMADTMSKVFQKNVRYNAITPDAYRALGFPGADDLGNMFQFKRDFNEYYCGARSVEFSRSLNPDLQTFERFLQLHKNEIPLE